MMCTFVIFSFLLTLISAQNTTTSLFLFGFFPDDIPPLAASVVGSSNDATTYVLNCNSGHVSDLCGLKAPLTLVEGPSTAVWSTVALVPGVTQHVSCALTGTTTGICTVTQTRGADFTSPKSFSVDPGDTQNTVEVATLNRTDISYQNVIITAGGEAVPSGSATTNANTASGIASPAGTPLSSAAPATTAKTSGATATSTSGTTGGGSSTAGMPRITQNAGLLIGGVVAAAGLAYGGM